MSKGIQPTIVLTQDDDGWWTARDETLGVTAQASTRDEALANLDAIVDAVDSGSGRQPTDEELRKAGIDPEENRRSGSGELPDVLD